jgi:hypothetical protein
MVSRFLARAGVHRTGGIKVTSEQVAVNPWIFEFSISFQKPPTRVKSLGLEVPGGRKSTGRRLTGAQASSVARIPNAVSGRRFPARYGPSKSANKLL